MKEDLFNHLEQNDVCKILSCYNDKPKYIFQLLLLDKIHIPPELLNLIMHFYQVILVHNNNKLILNHQSTINGIRVDHIFMKPSYGWMEIYVPSNLRHHISRFRTRHWNIKDYSKKNRHMIEYVYVCSHYGSIREDYDDSKEFTDYFKITNVCVGLRRDKHNGLEYKIVINPIGDLSLFKYVQHNNIRYKIDSNSIELHSEAKQLLLYLIPHMYSYGLKNKYLTVDMIWTDFIPIKNFTYNNSIEEVD